tara:strand:+ start:967 stop:2049 length:1083 start_codon:yes stop_codon:yes gene_type:complete
MANKDLFKQAIAEAKSVRSAAIANAKEALEESLTPHLKDMLAAKLQEMEDSSTEEVVKESDDMEQEGYEGKKDEAKANETTDTFEAAEDEAPEEEELDGEEEIAPVEDEAEEAADEIDGEEDLSNLSVDQFKDLIRDVIATEMGAGAGLEGEDELGADMDAGMDGGPEGEADLDMAPEDGEGEEEIDLDELLAELEGLTTEGDHADKDDKPVEESTENEVSAESDSKDKNVNDTLKEAAENKSDLKLALETVETLRSELNEVNILNSKLLYVNKIFKANTLSESQKVSIIAAFDKAETVREVKLVFETVSDNIVGKAKSTIKEHRGLASKATGTTASNPEVISQVSEAVLRMQKLAGIIK